MDNKIKLIFDSFGKERIKLNEPIKDYATLGVGGPAKAFMIVFSVRELIKVLQMSIQLRIPFFLFGTGSKIMISDSGFNGLVIKNRTKGIEIISVKGKATRVGIGIDEAMVETESGVSILKFIEFLKLHNLVYDEFTGIPGSVGGALFISKILQNRAKSIKVLDLNSNLLEIEPNQVILNKHIILSVVFNIKAISLV